jgi:hypothetical protein
VRARCIISGGREDWGCAWSSPQPLLAAAHVQLGRRGSHSQSAVQAQPRPGVEEDDVCLLAYVVPAAPLEQQGSIGWLEAVRHSGWSSSLRVVAIDQHIPAVLTSTATQSPAVVDAGGRGCAARGVSPCAASAGSASGLRRAGGDAAHSLRKGRPGRAAAAFAAPQWSLRSTDKNARSLNRQDRPDDDDHSSSSVCARRCGVWTPVRARRGAGRAATHGVGAVGGRRVG